MLKHGIKLDYFYSNKYKKQIHLFLFVLSWVMPVIWTIYIEGAFYKSNLFVGTCSRAVQKAEFTGRVEIHMENNSVFHAFHQILHTWNVALCSNIISWKTEEGDVICSTEITSTMGIKVPKVLLTNWIAYATQKFNATFTKALHRFLSSSFRFLLLQEPS